MPDPFKEPNVTLGIVMKAGHAIGPFTLKQSLAVELAKTYSQRDVKAVNNVIGFQHNMGVALVDLNEVTGITIVSGSLGAVSDLIDAVI